MLFAPQYSLDQLFVLQNIFGILYIFLILFRNSPPLCVDLSHKSPMKHIHVWGSNVTKYGKVKGV